MKVKTTIVLGVASLAAACAAPASRISNGLQRSGLDPARADCVGSRLQEDLSIGQLQQLGRGAVAYRKNDADPGSLNAADLLRVAEEIKDPAILLAIGKAAATCNVVP